MTEDARENNAFMTEDTIWDTGESRKKYELKLQRQLRKAYFGESLESKSTQNGIAL